MAGVDINPRPTTDGYTSYVHIYMLETDLYHAEFLMRSLHYVMYYCRYTVNMWFTHSGACRLDESAQVVITVCICVYVRPYVYRESLCSR